MNQAPTINGATHVYCHACDRIQPAIFERLEELSADGCYFGGDILCTVCQNVAASLYKAAS